MTLKHKKTSAKSDSGDATIIQPSDWNDDHTVIGGLDLPLETVSAPDADNVRLFGRKVGGRMMAAIMGPSGLDTSLQPLLGRNGAAFWRPAGSSTTVTQLGMAAATLGTATAATIATTNLHSSVKRLDYLVTTASTSAIAGWQSSAANTNQYCIGSGVIGGFHVILRFGGATGMATATHRCFAGMTSLTAAPTDVNPSTWANIIGVGYDSTDSNWQLMHKTGTGSVVKTDLGSSFPRQSVDRSKLYELALFTAPNLTSVGYEFMELGTSNTVAGTITSNLPAATTLLKAIVTCSVGGTSSVIGLSMVGASIETDH